MPLKLGARRQLRTVRLGDHSRIALSCDFDRPTKTMLRASWATVAKRRCGMETGTQLCYRCAYPTVGCETRQAHRMSVSEPAEKPAIFSHRRSPLGGRTRYNRNQGSFSVRPYNGTKRSG